MPKQVSFKEFKESKFSLSPLQYQKVNLTNKNTKTMKEILGEKYTAGKEVGSDSYLRMKTKYRFLRTSAIQDNNFQLNLDEIGSYEYIPPLVFNKSKGKSNERVISEGDLLFVTGGNVGEVAIAQNIENTLFSSHILRLPIEKSKLYVFAFLKNNFGKLQSNFSPSGAIEGLDTFDTDALMKVKIPFPTQKNSDEIIKYVECLVLSIINKEREIKFRHREIIDSIHKELSENQKPVKFKFSFPELKELRTVGRIDTARYTEEYKKFEHMISNYVHGKSSLTELGYDVFRGQNLQESAIGKSFYSDEHIDGFYRLAVSSNFSEYSTLNNFDYLGNSKSLKTIEKGDIIFSCRGAQFGRVIIFCDDVENTITNIDNVHIRKSNAKLPQSIFIALWLNFLRWNRHIYRIALTGSGANSLTQYQFDEIHFPNFTEKKQEELSKKYYNPLDYPKIPSISKFLELDNDWNKKSGLYQLDNSLNVSKYKLDEIIEQIVGDKKIDIDFSFMASRRGL